MTQIQSSTRAGKNGGKTLLTQTMRFARTEADVIAPERFGFVDLTDELDASVIASGIEEGCAVAFCRHTTATLIINEWEDGAQHDLRVKLQELAPTERYYKHDDLSCRTQNLQPDEPANGPAHVVAMLMGGASQTLPISEGRLALGRWQRLFLVELDQPKPRTVRFHILGV